MVLLHGVLERLDPTLVTEKPRVYQDKNPHGEIVTYRYQYRDEPAGMYVTVEISAKTGELRSIHNASARDSLSISKQSGNVGTLRKATDWLRWVDAKYTLDVEPYPTGRELNVIAHGYCFGYQVPDYRARLRLRREDGALRSAFFRRPQAPVMRPDPVTFSSESARTLGALALLQWSPEAFFFGEILRPSLAIVFVSSYWQPEVRAELYHGQLAPNFTESLNVDRSYVVSQYRLCYAVPFVVDRHFGRGGLYIDANNGRLCEREFNFD